MQEGLNIKIIIHWLGILMTITFLSFIHIDKTVLIIISTFLITTLIYNQVTFIKINSNEINKILFVADNCSYLDFEGAIITQLVTGSYFYDSKWKIQIITGQNQILESETSLSDKNVKKIKLYLSTYFDNKKPSWKF